MLPNELSVMLASLQRRELKENRRLGPGEKEEAEFQSRYALLQSPYPCSTPHHVILQLRI